MSSSTAILTDDEIVQLERDLRESRGHEQTSKAALRQLHQELKEVHFVIASNSRSSTTW